MQRQNFKSILQIFVVMVVDFYNALYFSSSWVTFVLIYNILYVATMQY